MKFRKLTVTPWIGIFATTFLFQLIRGEWTDAFIFLLATLLMMLQPFFHLKVKQIPRLTFDRRTLWAILISTVLLMSALSRESIFLAVLLVSAAILLFLELWGVPQHHHKDDQLTIKSKWVWALVALTVALIELSALLAARFTGDDQKYATISELVVPVLDTQWNRFIFGIVWIMVGWLVIRHWRRK